MHVRPLSYSAFPEALAEYPDMDQEAFDALDTNGDGLLTMEELLAGTVGEPWVEMEVYVDFGYVGMEAGTELEPFNTRRHGDDMRSSASAGYWDRCISRSTYFQYHECLRQTCFSRQK